RRREEVRIVLEHGAPAAIVASPGDTGGAISEGALLWPHARLPPFGGRAESLASGGARVRRLGSADVALRINAGLAHRAEVMAGLGRLERRPGDLLPVGGDLAESALPPVA